MKFLKRVLLRLLGYYLEPTDRERLFRVVGRSDVRRAGRGDRGEFTLTVRPS